jgi:pyruvate formate lyase activating enzyme
MSTPVNPLLKGMTIATGLIDARFDGLGCKDALIVGGRGCPLSCEFCQNYEVSQAISFGMPFDSHPFDVARVLRDKVIEDDLGGVVFTYSEPLLMLDLVGATRNVLRCSGPAQFFIAAKTSAHTDDYSWRIFLDYVDAVNIDVKGDDDFYRSKCMGFFGCVLRNARIAVNKGKRVELTFLMIPGMEEGLAMAMADMAREVGDVPAWIRGFVPAHRMKDVPMATKEDVSWARNMASHYFSIVRTSYI